MRITLPENVRSIIQTLEEHGYEGYAVGGCVRDSVLGREPDDWDITTSAKPEELKKLFRRTVDTGIQHGTVTVLMGEEGYEVTTYRLDGEYEDSRHPKEVTFTAELREDLKRRDFTINAMAYNDRVGFVDEFEGLNDLENHVIRCVGDPKERFLEDALRILRAVRFSAQLGFEIEEQTAQAAMELAETLQNISAERVRTELVKLLISAHPEYLKKAWELKLTAVVLPEFDEAMETEQNNPHHCYTVGEHTLTTLEHTPAETALRLSALFHDFGKPLVRSTDEEGIDHFYGHADVSAEMAAEIMHRLKFDNDTLHKVKCYVKNHDVRPALNEKSVRKAVGRIGEDAFPQILKLKMADTLAQAPSWQPEKKEYLAELEAIFQGILERKECLSLKELAVNGRDLIADGMKPGKEIGSVLQNLLNLVLEEPEKNKKDLLLLEARRIRNAEA